MGKKIIKGIAFIVLVIVLFVSVKGISGFLHVRRDLELVAAAGNGRTAEVKLLLAQGASPNAMHIEGSSALWWAVSRGDYPTVKLLLDNGANPNSRGQYNSVISEALDRLMQTKDASQKKEMGAIIKELVAKGAVVP